MTVCFLPIAISKWIGILAPSILFRLLGTTTTGGPNILMLVTGILISALGIACIFMLGKALQTDRGILKEEVLF